MLAGGLLFCAGLVGYYGLAFGAGHCLDRYLFPASPFIALMNAACVLALSTALSHVRWARAGQWALAAGLLVVVAGLDGRAYRQGRRHQHFQVVEWVVQNVAPTTWVAAIQTGTLGFFHDRTVNLDGKVNPEALALVKSDRIPEYVAASRWGKEQAMIDYLVDWSAIAGWDALVPVHSNFDLIVDNPQLNLAVFRRKSTTAYSLR